MKIVVVAVLISLLIPISGFVSATTASPSLDTNWGRVFVAKTNANYAEIGYINLTWWGCPMIEYRVIGIGKHYINWTVTYNVTTSTPEGLWNQTGSFEGENELYFFDFSKRPIIKIFVSSSGLMPFFMFQKGEWTVKLYVDGALWDEDSMFYEHH